jgi:hypothetical protein
MPVIDPRLLECNGEPEFTENFNRVLNLVDANKGSAETNASVISALSAGAFIELYLADNSTAVSVPAGTDYTAYDTLLMTCDKHNGLTLETVEGAQSVKATTPGLYYVNATFSSKLGTSDVIWDTAVFVNGVEATNLHMRRRFSTLGYTFNVSLSGLVTLSADDVLDVRVKHNNASAVSVTTEYANISLHKFADTPEG